MIWWIILGWILSQLETPIAIWALFWVCVLVSIAITMYQRWAKRLKDAKDNDSH